jgi:hypothetical protein
MIEKLKFWMFRLLNNVRCWIALKPYAKATLTIGLGDVLLNRRELMTIQMIVAARLLDVEKFFKDGDYSSYYSLSLSRYSGSKAPASVQQEHNARFKRLMESIRTEGYDPKSAICVNRDFVMFNGTHRIATVLHLNYDSIVADIFKKSALTLNTWESWRRPFTFPDEFLNKLYKKTTIFKIS